MTSKVIYVSYMRLSDKASRDWYVDFLLSKGVEVEYWDLVPLLFGGAINASKQTGFLRVPDSYREVQLMIQRPENKGANYILLLSYEGRTVEIFRLLSRFDCRMYFIAWGAQPINYVSKLRVNWSDLVHPIQFLNRVYYKFKAIYYKKFNLIKPFDAVFAAGADVATSKHYTQKVIPINFIDYEQYRISKQESTRFLIGRYVVFLDVNFPYQSDLDILGLQTINAPNYYATLNRFFSLVEAKFGVEVVICAHPKAKYSCEIFDGRQIYQGCTPLLVSDADFVISHHSTSLSYAILNHKPIVFIYTNEIKDLYQETVVKYLFDFSEYLDSHIYNIDEITECDQIMVSQINYERYQEYKYRYITTPESEGLNNSDILWGEICAH